MTFDRAAVPGAVTGAALGVWRGGWGRAAVVIPGPEGSSVRQRSALTIDQVSTHDAGLAMGSTITQCHACGGSTRTRREKRYRYTECGLPNVVIDDVVDVTTCERCGETYTSIPAIDDLHRQIAAAVIRKKGRLAPAEIRFLRKHLGWSGVDFARRSGTKPETVSRWENGRTIMGPQADRLLRVLVAKQTPAMEYPVDLLAQVAADDGPATPVRVELEKGPNGWTFRRGPGLVTA